MRAVATSEAAIDERAAPAALDDALGLRIRLAHGAVYRHFTETFAPLDLTQKQLSLLWLVGDHPGIAQTELARRLRMDRATTMGIVNRLAARGFLRRGAAPFDRRRKALYLEPAGAAMLTRARAALADHEAWLTARFSSREVDTLIGLLARIHG